MNSSIKLINIVYRIDDFVNILWHTKTLQVIIFYDESNIINAYFTHLLHSNYVVCLVPGINLFWFENASERYKQKQQLYNFSVNHILIHI